MIRIFYRTRKTEPSERRFYTAIITNSHTYSNSNLEGSFEYLAKKKSKKVVLFFVTFC